MKKELLTRLTLISIILFIALVSFGQVKPNKDIFQKNREPDIKVTLLGTGSPQPIIERFGPSILVQAGRETLLFDAGRGLSLIHI